MVNEDTSTSAAELRPILQRIVRDGEWDFAEMADRMGAQPWMRWFSLRLDGQDPFFDYARDERAYGRGNLFHDLFYHLHHDPGVSRQTISSIQEDASSGLDYFLRKLNRRMTEAGESPPVRSERVHEALDLIGRTRTDQTDSRESVRELLRDWITSERLLEEHPGSISSEQLHRSALFALAELQKPGDDRDREVWERWFEEAPYKLAAFSGMARSVTFEPAMFESDPSTPMDGCVATVLRYAKEKRDRGEPVLEGFALETLYMDDDDPELVMRYLWNEAEKMDDRAETWEHLQELLADTNANLLDEDEMRDFVDMFDRRPESQRDLVPAGAEEESGTGWVVFRT